jgi:hypothetical protein
MGWLKDDHQTHSEGRHGGARPFVPELERKAAVIFCQLPRYDLRAVGL